MLAKIKEKERIELKHILAVVLAFTLTLGLAVPGMALETHAASLEVRSNVSVSPVTGNSTVANMPATVKEPVAGSTYYINMQTNNWKMTKVELWIMQPGGSSFYCADIERASNYIRYAYFPLRFTKAGTYRYFLRVTSKEDGNVYTYDVKTITVKASKNSGFEKKVESFIADSRFKNGVSWGGSRTPKLSSYKCKGCCAYVADFVKYVFGKASPRSGSRFTNIGSIRAGDVVHLSPDHWIAILERNGNSLKTAEGNASGKVVVSNSKYKISGNYIKSSYSSYKFTEGYHFK